ncbi:hypothetical protein [Flagellimonas myxillae]|uniref:hypothetical protein n=1 Tax=Flagellimonas myxillae TaxID=2942214 RepID=UPI00201F4E54|nr:hypothetical protein [Muricauda myxillae]MCL6267505.1 hypothetical protein [Muricauda myxillae]
MTKRKLIQQTRKWHRYLGVILGVQFLLWTLGGLYFSWTNIEEIRGEHLREKPKFPNIAQGMVSPDVFIQLAFEATDSIVSLELINVLDEPIYRVVYNSDTRKKARLFHASNGETKAPLSEKEAILVAKDGLKEQSNVTHVEYLTTAGKHHEYRGRPLPAFAIDFAEPANTTIYVSAEYGDIQTFRSNQWRAFDFLWMLHTMDYEGRDNFNNYLLRAFAFFGLFTILSGFSLFIFTSRIFRKKSAI